MYKRLWLLAALAVVAIAVVAAACSGGKGEPSTPPTPAATPTPTARPTPTPTPGPTSAPGISTESEWRLVLDGFVQSPLSLTFEDLLAMPKSTVHAELYCVGSPTTVLAKGDWTGVRLGLLLEDAEVSPEAVKVAFYADDGFATDLTVATATRDDIILAYERNGEPLTEKLRLVVPGKWGYKWIRDVTHIEVVDYDFKGFYESSGYSDEADISSNPQ